MLYLAIIALLTVAAGSIALVLGVRRAKDGREDADGFHGAEEFEAHADSPLAALGRGVVHLPRQPR